MSGQSRLIQIIETVQTWASHSRIIRLLNNSKLIAGILALFLLFSILRVLMSGMAVTIRFLSFVILAILVGLVIWSQLDTINDP